MVYYARYFSELPKTFVKARDCKVGELRKYGTLVEARRYGARSTTVNGVVLVYARNPSNYAYAISNPLQNPDLIGYVDFNSHIDWHFWNIPDRIDKGTGEVYFKARPMYNNGRMAGRF